MKEILSSRKLINNKGPRNDHCGTPCYIYFYLLVLRCLFHCSLAFFSVLIFLYSHKILQNKQLQDNATESMKIHSNPVTIT